MTLPSHPLATAALFVLTAVMEIVGCFLPTLWLRGRAGSWVLLPAALALTAFVALLALHPTASGRVYAAYGGVYVATAIAWLWLVDGVRPTTWDIAGSAVALTGMLIIVWAGARAVDLQAILGCSAGLKSACSYHF